LSDDLLHVTPVAAELLRVPQDQRICAILGERWAQYIRAAQVRRILDLLLEHPRTTRMPSVALYGDSGMGKTMIMHRFGPSTRRFSTARLGSSAHVSLRCNRPASRVSGSSTPRSCRRWACRRTRGRL
jgi:hypothetical protein